MKYIDGGVCSAKGFRAGGMNCGIKAGSTKKDLAMIVSDTMCSAAAVYTTNKVKGAPLADAGASDQRNCSGCDL